MMRLTERRERVFDTGMTERGERVFGTLTTSRARVFGVAPAPVLPPVVIIGGGGWGTPILPQRRSLPRTARLLRERGVQHIRISAHGRTQLVALAHDAEELLEMVLLGLVPVDDLIVLGADEALIEQALLLSPTRRPVERGRM